MLALSAPDGEMRVLLGVLLMATLAKASLLICKLDRRRVDSISLAQIALRRTGYCGRCGFTTECEDLKQMSPLTESLLAYHVIRTQYPSTQQTNQAQDLTPILIR